MSADRNLHFVLRNKQFGSIFSTIGCSILLH